MGNRLARRVTYDPVHPLRRGTSHEPACRGSLVNHGPKMSGTVAKSRWKDLLVFEKFSCDFG